MLFMSLFDRVGVTAFLIPFALVLLGIGLLFKRPWRELLRRFVACMGMLLPISVLFSYYANQKWMSLPFSPGGELGARFLHFWPDVDPTKGTLFVAAGLVAGFVAWGWKGRRALPLAFLLAASGLAFASEGAFEATGLQTLVGLKRPLNLWALSGLMALLYVLFAGRKPAEPVRWSWRTEWVVLCALTLLGLYFRVNHISEIPAGCYYDEAGGGLAAVETIQNNLYFRKIKFLQTHQWAVIAFFKMFGENVTALRAGTAVSAALTIPILYVFARALFGTYAAIAATTLLAVSHWHVTFSRIAFAAIHSPLFEIMTVGCFLAFLRGRSWAYLVGFVVTVLFGCYTYAPYFLVPFLLAGLFVHHLVFVILGKKIKIRYVVALCVGGVCVALSALFPAIQKNEQWDLLNSLFVWASPPSLTIPEGFQPVLLRGLIALGVVAGLAILPLLLRALSMIRQKHMRRSFRSLVRGILSVPGRILFSWRQWLRPAVGFLMVLFCAGAIIEFLIPDGSRSTTAPASVAKSRYTEMSFMKNMEKKDYLNGFMENLKAYLGMYGRRGDPIARHGIPEKPAMEYVSVSLGLLGLVLCLWRFYRTGHFGLLIWFPLMMVPGVLSVRAPSSLRAISTCTPAFLFFGIALGEVWSQFRQGIGKYVGTALALPVVILCLGWVIKTNYRIYFKEQAKNISVYRDYETAEAEVGKLIRRLQDLYQKNVDVYVQPEAGRLGLTFTSLRCPSPRIFEPLTSLPLRVPEPSDLTVLALPMYHSNIVNALKTYYPYGIYREVCDPSNGPFFFTFFITRGDQMAIRGCDVWYGKGEIDEGRASMQRRHGSLKFDWSIEPPMDPPFWFLARTYLFCDRQDLYTFRVATNDPLSVSVDGNALSVSSQEPHHVEFLSPLSVGYHLLELKGTESGIEPGFQVLWKGSDAQPVPIPAQVLCTVAPQVDAVRGTPMIMNPIEYRLVRSWKGMFGHGLAVTPDKEVVTVERSGGVQKIRVYSAEGQVLREWGELGREGPAFQCPIGLAAGNNGHIFLDELNYEYRGGVIKEYDSTGKFIKEYFGFWGPRSVAACPDGDILVGDAGNSAVKKITPDGQVIRNVNGSGSEPGMFIRLAGVACGPDGQLFAVDPGNSRIQCFDKEGKVLFVRSLDGLSNEISLAAASPDGVFYVTAPESNRIYAFRQDGVGMQTSWLDQAGNPFTFQWPTGIAFAKDGTVFVCQPRESAILCFEPMKKP